MFVSGLSNCKPALLRSGLASLALTTAVLIGLAPILHAQTDGLQKINHVVVIYQENWSFDSLYGRFPGANGLQSGFDTLSQYDKSTNYTSLIYQMPRPLTGFPLVPDPNFPASPDGHLALWSDHSVALPVFPYDFTNYIAADVKTGDIVH